MAMSLHQLSWKQSRLNAARLLPAVGLCILALAGFSVRVSAQEITVINPGGELYTTPPNFSIPQSPIPPGDGTGWNATTDSVAADHAVEAIGNTANSGVNRLAFGATATSAFDPEDVILFQQTSHVVAAGQELILNFFGRGFFEFQNDFDDQVSFFGYLDGSSSLVQVDTKTHTNIVAGAWNAAGHTFNVPSGSPLIGESLVIGFYTTSLNGDGFSSVDDVSLSLGMGGLACDADGDGDCDFEDVEVIAGNFLETVPVGTMGDLDNTGFVDFADFHIWKDTTGFGGSLADALAAAEQVPEPGSLWFVATASIAVLWRAHRRKKRD